MTMSTVCWMLAHRSCTARTECDCPCHTAHLSDPASAMPARTPLRAIPSRPVPRVPASETPNLPSTPVGGNGGLRPLSVNGTPSPKVRPARRLQPPSSPDVIGTRAA